MRRGPLLTAALLLPAAAAAAAPADPAAPQFLARLLGSTLLVGAFVFVLAWLARRLRLQPRSGDGRLEVLAEFAVGSRERVLLLRVGDRQALVGVGTGSVSSLQLLEAPVTLEPRTAAAAGGFLEQLRRALAGGGKP